MRKMKDTIYPWLGKIPVSWNTSKLLYCLRQQICDGPHETPNVIDDGIPFISIDSLNESKHVDLSIVKKFISEEDYLMYRQKTNLEKGDILFSKSATIGKTAIVGDEVFMVWSPLAIIKSKVDSIQNEYLYYLLNCDELIASIRLSGSFNTQANVGMREMERAVIPVPPLDEQKIVAQFLDSKCAEIDALFADIQSEIDTLEAYKRSVITEAVTKGLDKNAPMKDSGIEWVGKIPTTWDVKKGKYCLRYVQKPTKPDDDVITCFRDGEVTLRKNRREEGFTISLKEIGYQGIDVGDLIVHGMDGFAGAIGISDSRGKASPVLNVLDTDNNKRYIMYYLRSLAFNGVFLALSTGIRVRTCDTNWGKLRELLYVLPPKKEQDDIVRFIDERLNSTDEIIAQKQEQLAVLADYKKSIIYEYVTGKKEVPVA